MCSLWWNNSVTCDCPTLNSKPLKKNKYACTAILCNVPILIIEIIQTFSYKIIILLVYQTLESFIGLIIVLVSHF